MNGRVGAMVMIAIVVAGMRLAVSPARNPLAGGWESRTSVVPKKASHGETSCDAFGESPSDTESSSTNEINALVERYLHGIPQTTSLQPHAVPDGITFLVVTVPDPLHTLVGLPALGLIVAQFPEIADFVVSWVQPSMNAAK